MTMADAAVAARDTFDGEHAQIMLAIAGAESAYNAKALGDRLSNFNSADREKYAPWSCADFCSVGLWQIFMPVHHEMLKRLSGLDGSCSISNWLTNPFNNARAAKEILGSQGLSAWSTYNDGQYQTFINEAGAALSSLPPRRDANLGYAITAVSLSGEIVHLDREDGSFDERHIAQATPINGWLRLDLDQPVIM